MTNYILSCCSTADLTKEHLQKRNISYIPFHFELDGKQYLDDLGQSMPFEQFYHAMLDGADTKTSQINAEEFTEYFEPFLKEGKDIVHVTLSSGISGVYNSACIAKNELEERYPDRKIYIIDSLNASSGYGLFMDKLTDLRVQGMSASELASWAEENKYYCHAWFFSSDLTFFVKGGRVSKTSGFVGNLLNICPLLNVNSEGKLVPRLKIRTKKKAIAAIVDKMKELAKDGTAYNGKCYISNSACEEDAKSVAKLIQETFPNVDDEILINSIGTTIGSHTGPGTVALFFWGNKRNDL